MCSLSLSASIPSAVVLIPAHSVVDEDGKTGQKCRLLLARRQRIIIHPHVGRDLRLVFFFLFRLFRLFRLFVFFSYLGGWWGRGACHRRASSCGEETAIHSADFFGIQLVGRRIGSSIANPGRKPSERSSHQRTKVRVEELLVVFVADAHAVKVTTSIYRTSICKVGCAQRLKIAVAVNL